MIEGVSQEENICSGMRKKNSLALKVFLYQSNLDPALRENPGHELSVRV